MSQNFEKTGQRIFTGLDAFCNPRELSVKRKTVSGRFSEKRGDIRQKRTRGASSVVGKNTSASKSSAIEMTASKYACHGKKVPS